MLNKYNTLTLGSTGFAQFGQPLQYEKSRIEKEVLLEYFRTNEHTKVPEEFLYLAFFIWKREPYEYDCYYELNVRFECDITEYPEEDDQELIDRETLFFEWFNRCESIDMESEEMLDKCYALFKEKYPMHVIHKRDQDDDQLNVV